MPLRGPDKVIIETERLVLRMPRRGEESVLQRFYSENRVFLQPFSPTFGDEIFTVRGWRDRIDATLAEYRNGRGLRLMLIPKGQPLRVLGIANFTSINGFPTYVCNLGYAMAEAEQGKGIITEALRGAIHYVFEEMKLHRIEANYMPRNVASARVLEKLGFVIEGRAQEYILINGVWEEHIRTSLTNRRWVAPR